MKLKRDIRRVADKVLPILGSRELTAKWIFTENPMLDGLTPAQMVARGRKGKVIKLIEKYKNDADSSTTQIPNVD